MIVKETGFEGLLEIFPTVYKDERGWFYESYNKNTYKENGITTEFVQENQSFSKKGVVRGLHLQKKPFAQAKLVTVITGKIVDVVVDLRPDSKTFKQVYYCEMDGIKKNYLLVPEGFAHGFVALEDTHFYYKCSGFYNKQAESGIIWKDADLAIDWQIKNPIISEKDEQLQTLEQFLNKS